jgi:hypothetical protein
MSIFSIAKVKGPRLGALRSSFGARLFSDRYFVTAGTALPKSNL